VADFLNRLRRSGRDTPVPALHPDGAALGTAAARRLRQLGHVTIQPGLTEREFACVEESFGFQFADDHRAFLAAGLPVGPSWPDWRRGNRPALRDRLELPVHGVLFDVEHNGFWHAGWGERPDDRRAAVAAAEPHLRRVPRLVPVFSHRFLPAGRGSFGHPVLSVHQTDIIFYGVDLADYVHAEFGGPAPERRGEPSATVPFWRDFV
jgi:hypothetical protein